MRTTSIFVRAYTACVERELERLRAKQQEFSESVAETIAAAYEAIKRAHEQLEVLARRLETAEEAIALRVNRCSIRAKVLLQTKE
jgi:lipopolysaccharide biosynthesis regulator YciM